MFKKGLLEEDQLVAPVCSMLAPCPSPSQMQVAYDEGGLAILPVFEFAAAPEKKRPTTHPNCLFSIYFPAWLSNLSPGGLSSKQFVLWRWAMFPCYQLPLRRVFLKTLSIYIQRTDMKPKIALSTSSRYDAYV